MSEQRESLEFVEAVLEALPQAALLVSAEGRVSCRNARADDILPDGGGIEDVLRSNGRPAIDWAKDRDAVHKGAGRLIRTGVGITGRGTRRLRVDVTVGQVHARDPVNQQPRGYLVLVEDVSGRQSMERRLAARERIAAAGVVGAKVAHELNNPLDGVMRFVGLAERTAGEDAAEYLRKAREGLERMSQIIRGLLDQGRPWGGAGERAGVQRLLREAIDAMLPRAEAAGVGIVTDVDDRAEGAVGAESLQVFCNIIKNAIDAMPGGGRLTIRVRPDDDGCLVEFRDTGSGLDADGERVFEPFYSTKAPSEGSGLGLTICRDIVRRLGGDIAAANLPAGGTGVTVRLPRLPAADANGGTTP